MDDFALTAAERALFQALNRRDVKFILLGMGAALLHGAPVATQDLDIWFEQTDDPRIGDAARDASGFWIPGFGLQPPAFGGAGLDRVNIVLTAHGLDPFAIEYERATVQAVEGITLRVLPLDRIIATKRATHRPKGSRPAPDPRGHARRPPAEGVTCDESETPTGCRGSAVRILWTTSQLHAGSGCASAAVLAGSRPTAPTHF